ncbi:MAG: C-GCAxxG-C-C family protein [Sphaerochaetaceae bacterium]|nr:C-GCAxxG-C-C family protein [Sphaerochaetaceae bacterium]
MNLQNVRKYYLEQGYNCAEATLMAISEDRGITLSRDEVKLIGAFGGGMACGEACGALCASVAVIGKLLIEDKAHSTPALKDNCRKYVELFREKMGSIDCRDIKPRNSVEGQRCLKTVAENYEILSDFLEGLCVDSEEL